MRLISAFLRTHYQFAITLLRAPLLPAQQPEGPWSSRLQTGHEAGDGAAAGKGVSGPLCPEQLPSFCHSATLWVPSILLS